MCITNEYYKLHIVLPILYGLYSRKRNNYNPVISLTKQTWLIFICFFKDLMPITFSSPRAQSEVVYFWYQMKAHIFLIVNSKLQLNLYWHNVLIIGNWTHSQVCSIMLVKTTQYKSSGISSANLLRALEISDLPPAISPELNKFFVVLEI